MIDDLLLLNCHLTVGKAYRGLYWSRYSPDRQHNCFLYIFIDYAGGRGRFDYTTFLCSCCPEYTWESCNLLRKHIYLDLMVSAGPGLLLYQELQFACLGFVLMGYTRCRSLDSGWTWLF